MPRATLEELGFTPDRYGLLQRWLVHELDQGGTLTQLSGIQGCGKTTAELHAAYAALLLGETVIWRGRPVDSWPFFPGPVKVWSDRPLTFYRAPLDGGDLEEWTGPNAPRVHLYDGPADIVRRAEPGVLNVVFAREEAAIWPDPSPDAPDDAPSLRFWDAVVCHLAEKLETRWHYLIIDEAHEIWWDRPQKDDGAYARQTRVRDALADFRKTYNSLLIASHASDEIDYRILAKIQFQLYGRGARPISKSRVHKELPLSLSQGQFILDSLYFATIQFPKIPRPPYQFFTRPTTGRPTSQEDHTDDTPAVQA